MTSNQLPATPVATPDHPPAHDAYDDIGYVASLAAHLDDAQMAYLAEVACRHHADTPGVLERIGLKLSDVEDWRRGSIEWVRLEARVRSHADALGPKLARMVYDRSQAAIARQVVGRTLAKDVRDRDLASLARLAHDVSGVTPQRGQSAPSVSFHISAMAYQIAQEQAVPSSPPIVPPAAPGPVVLDVPSRSSDGTSAPGARTPDADTGAP